MKNKKHKKGLELLILFLGFFGIIFVGFCLCNAIAVIIDCLFNGFNCFGARMLDLPFLLYLCLSLALSAILTVFVKTH